MSIVAQSADGTTHEFPDGTAEAVVDKVMKDYALQSAPQSQGGQPTQEPQYSKSLGFAEGLSKPAANIDRGLAYLAKQFGMDTGGEQRYQNFEHYDPNKDSRLLTQAMGWPGREPSPTGKFVGEMVGTAPATLLTGPLAGGAAFGALTSDADTPQGLAADTALSAAGGKVGDVALKGLAKVVSPKISDAAKYLSSKGVPLTIGQTLGGTAKGIEDKASSIPILGDAIKKAQGRSIEGLNRSVANDALAPVGKSLPNNIPVGRDAVEYVAKTLGDEYDNLLPQLSGHADQQFYSDLGTHLRNAKDNLPDAQFDQLRKIIKTQIIDKAAQGNGHFDGETLKGIQSELTRRSKGYSGDPSFDTRELGDAVSGINTALRDMLARKNPQYAAQLGNINKGYAIYDRLRRASSSLAAKDGVFTPAQLNNAVRAADKSVAKGQFARGNALLQDTSDAAVTTLPQTIPNSGSVDRALIAGLGLGGASALHAAVSPASAVAMLLGPALYSRPGQKALHLLATGAPQTRAKIARGLLSLHAPATLLGIGGASQAKGLLD